MSTPPAKTPANRSNPFLLIVVAVLVLAAIAFGIAKLTKSPAEEETVEAADGGSNRKSARYANPTSVDALPTHGTKSEGGRDGSRPGKGAAAAGTEGIDNVFVEVSISAREELKRLREKHATEYDDPNERQAFGVRLGQITDPQERQRVLQERTEAMRQARARVDASKSPADQEREKQLIVLMQVQNLSRMAEFVSKNPSLRSEADAFDQHLVEWVEDSGQMDPATFHSSFNELRDTLNELRRRNAQHTNPGATRANLPSERPERK